MNCNVELTRNMRYQPSVDRRGKSAGAPKAPHNITLIPKPKLLEKTDILGDLRTPDFLPEADSIGRRNRLGENTVGLNVIKHAQPLPPKSSNAFDSHMPHQRPLSTIDPAWRAPDNTAHNLLQKCEDSSLAPPKIHLI